MLNSLEERIIKGLRRIAIWRKMNTGRDLLAVQDRDVHTHDKNKHPIMKSL
jgi:hypothetical protein